MTSLSVHELGGYNEDRCQAVCDTCAEINSNIVIYQTKL